MRINYIDNLEGWRSGFNFHIPIKVRFSETDMYGHVNNVSPFIYFEEARIDYLQDLGIVTDISNKDSAIIVADLQCDYWKQIYFNEELKLYVKVASAGNTSFDLHYMALKEDDDIVLTGRGRIVHINPQTGQSKPLTEEMKRKML
ncbi:acyl-CoA thioesterase [Oceanobacillus rekensis]|uniref:acyl-CoA thioesterase n=1 Tax=Oceanobacillus rekensis TaxID=937927 RepID=UPI000B438C38|nr:thioesterase family protein [Oceanobacillus rekensis]